MEWFKRDSKNEYELQPMEIQKDCVTVTGISGGSYMATQLHVIFSDWIKGVGLLLGGAFAST